jgi:hypothetical protein
MDRQGFNNSLTEKGTERLREFIKTRETELKTIQKELLDETKRMQTCDNAIFNLEATIPEAKQILKANEDSLTSLLNIRSRLNSVELIKEKTLKEESGTMKLCAEFRSYSKKPLGRLSKYIEDQITALKTDVRALWDKARELELELGSWKVSKRLLQRAISRLNAHCSEIQADIKAGNDTFRPIWNMPSDAWVRVFKYAIQEELAAYLKENPNNQGMRPPIFNLCQVCQSWRYVVHNAPELWTLAYVAPANVWRQDEHGLVTTSLEKANDPITILTNLSQSFWTNYQHNRRYDKNNAYGSIVSPNENTLFNGKEYTLLVDMYDDNSTFMQRLSYFPLRQPTSLVFSSRTSIRHNYIFNYFSTLSTVKSFSLINDNPASLPNVSLASYLPQLQKLTLHVKAFPNGVQIGNLLTNTLHELYLRNDGGGTCPNLGYIQLPQLRVLGITSPGSYLLDRLTARGVKSLILYGPQDCGSSQLPLSQQSSTIYSQILHLKFEGWRKPNSVNASLGAVAVFRDLISRMLALQTVKFVACFVDGRALVLAIETKIGDNGDSTHSRKLEELTLTNTTGIVNDQCEELKKLAARVKIYV